MTNMHDEFEELTLNEMEAVGGGWGGIFWALAKEAGKKAFGALVYVRNDVPFTM